MDVFVTEKALMPLPQAAGRKAEPSVKSYWPEIDGLRAVAIVSVFVFHLYPSLLPGGFAGVDVFFVISGYLITSILASDIESRNFSILRFYQRRIARIAPAAFLVIFTTLAAGFFLYSAQDFASAGATAIAASLSFINVKLIYQGSYFALSPDAQPLIHFWSLAVEEQFYLIFPVFLLALMRLTRWPLLIVSGVGVASFVACVVITPVAPTAAFYLLPTRAWELLAGAALSLVKRRNLRLDEWWSSACLNGGSLLIMLSFLVVRNAGFPGWIAALPVAGTALALTGIVFGGRGVMRSAFDLPIAKFIGKRSYSLYLWHWPVFSFIDYHFYYVNGPVEVGLKILISLAAAFLCYEFVEYPLRFWLNGAKRNAISILSFVTVASLICILGYVVRSDYYLSAEPRTISKGGILLNAQGDKWVVVIGDSQGAMYGYELASLARELDFRLNILSAAAENELPSEPGTLWPEVSKFLGDRKPDVIVLAEAWSLKLGINKKQHLGDILAELGNRTPHIIVLTQPPAQPAAATRQAMLQGSRPPFFEDAAAARIRLSTKEVIQGFGSNQIQIVDVAGALTESDGSVRATAPNGRVTYHDVGHLSDAGTSLVRPELAGALKAALGLQ